MEEGRRRQAALRDRAQGRRPDGAGGIIGNLGVWPIWPNGQRLVAITRRDQMALFDDILSGNWVTSLAIGVGAVVVLPLAAPILRPPAKTAIKGCILACQGAAELVEGISD